MDSMSQKNKYIKIAITRMRVFEADVDISRFDVLVFLDFLYIKLISREMLAIDPVIKLIVSRSNICII